MNLFVTDPDPILSAQALDDKRVGKLLMECCQMLSVAVKVTRPEMAESPGLTAGFAYQNHPVSIWVRATQENYDWTLEHAKALAYEYRLRFGKDHASGDRLPHLEALRDCLLPGGLLPFANCARNAGLEVDFTYLPVPWSYRHYLSHRWKHDVRPVTFTGRGEPAWRHIT